jgi:hypothetical protein
MELRLLRSALGIYCLTSLLEAQTAQPPAVPEPPIGVMRKALLEDMKPYEVAVGTVPTTILMPAVIEAFEGNNITTIAQTAAPVFLQHEPGTRFFSVKALVPGTADLNVIIGDAVYSFRFYYSENPTRTLVIQTPPKPSPGMSRHIVRITAHQLYDILQDAKTYFVIKDQQPDFERSIDVRAPGKILEYPGYRIIIDQVFRFDRQDTLVFRAIFLNDTNQALSYKPEEIGLRVGENIYWPSFAQVPRIIPPRTAAHLTWQLSPEITKVVLTNPAGKTAEVTNAMAAPLYDVGDYTIQASAADGRTDTLKFTVKFPVPANEPNPLVVSKSPKDFGIRQLALEQPDPGQNFGYVCYTGTADGRRADLNIDNNFTLIVPATPTPQ